MMSRSFRKSPFIGVCGGSDKWDKRVSNRRLRRRVLECLERGEEPPKIREVSDVYWFNKDGKTMVSDKKWLRK
jgi:hypothetical protein